MSGWRAKQKTVALKTRRGFGAPRARQASATGSGGGEPHARSAINASEDDRKKKSICASCKKVGHWKGDAESPEVKAGRVPLF